MKTDKGLMSIVLIAVLLAGGLFALDWRTSSHAQTTVIVLTVTPLAQTINPPVPLNNVSGALPDIADFLRTAGITQDPQAVPVAQAAQVSQAAPPPGPSVTGWLDPSLGKVIIVDGVSRKMKCEGLEGNSDFGGLNDAQKVIARDACNQLR